MEICIFIIGKLKFTQETELLLDQKFDCLPILNALDKTKGLPKSVNDKDEKNNKIKFSGLSFPDNSISDQGTNSR